MLSLNFIISDVVDILESRWHFLILWSKINIYNQQGLMTTKWGKSMDNDSSFNAVVKTVKQCLNLVADAAGDVSKG